MLFFFRRYGAEINDCFFSVNDRWMDFLNPLSYAEGRWIFRDAYANSPPFLAFFSWAIGHLSSFAGITRETAYLVCWFIFVMIQMVTAVILCNKKIIPAIVMATSFPMWYCFDRGNMVFIVAALISIFLIAYEHKRYTLAAVIIGIAASFKIYPAILGAVLLADKKWKAAGVCVITAVVCTVIPLLAFHDGFAEAIRIWIERTQTYASVGNGILEWLHDDKSSLNQLILIPKVLSGEIQTIEDVPTGIGLWKAALMILMGICGIWSCFAKRNHDRILMLSLLMIGFPIESGVYNLVLILIPMVYWCVKEKEAVFVPIAGAFLISCESFWMFSSDPHITWQAIIHPVCIVVLMAYLFILRGRERAAALRRNS